MGVEENLDTILRSGAIHPAYQPIVLLESGQVIGYEALARTPDGAAPEELFDHARRAGRLAELDWITRTSAARDALAAGLPYEVPLFVNVEPAALSMPVPPQLADIDQASLRDLQVVVEFTERSLLLDPAGLLATAERVRGRTGRIALDDVGPNPASLTMMPVLSPDVIKLDRSLIQGRTTPAVSRVVNAVLAESERTGAVILAEGIETERHRRVAAALGATLGQGWLFGRPGALPEPAARSGNTGFVLPRVAVPTDGPPATPFDVAARRRPSIRATKKLLLPLSQHLENRSLPPAEPTILLATFQDARNFTGETRRRYAELAEHGVLTAVFGTGMPNHPGPGLRSGPLHPGDPLVDDWTVIVLGDHFAAGLFARQRPDHPAGRKPEFDMIISHDRDLIVEAARVLLRRLPQATFESWLAGAGAVGGRIHQPGPIGRPPRESH